MPLTSLRFFAAAAIVLFHLGTSGIAPWGSVPALANGVSFFFVLSGFILTYNYDGRNEPVGRFYLARLARVWPLHFATLMIVMFMLPQTGVWATDISGAPIFLANLLLLQSWIPSNAYTMSFNGVSWSISTELFFYAVFPFALLFRRLWLLAGAALVFTLAIVAYAALTGSIAHAGAWDRTWANGILHVPPMRLFEFLTGMAAARLFMARGRFTGDTTNLEIAAIALVVATVAGMQNLAGIGPSGVWLSQCGSFFAFAVLVYVFAAGNGQLAKMLNNPALVMLGEISFATYMVHQIVIRHAVQSKMAAMWHPSVTLAVVILAAYLASYALWRLVEVPCRRAIMLGRQSLIFVRKP